MQSDEIHNGLYDFTEQLLGNKRQVRIKVGGYSMYPYLRNEDIITVERCSFSELKKGDIIVFKSNNKWIAHRLLKKSSGGNNNTLTARGDTCAKKDPPITENNYIGKVISYSRKSKKKNINNASSSRKNKLRAELSLLRTPFLIVILRLLMLGKKISSNTSSLKKNILFLARSSKKLVWANVIISVFQGAIPFIIIYLVKLLIDNISKVGEHNDKSEFFNTLLFIIVLTGAAFLINTLLTLINGYSRERLSQSLSIYIYNLLHKKHTQLDMAYLEDSEKQDIIHRAVQEAGFRPLKIITEALSGIQALISLLFVLFIFLEIHWIVFVLLLIAVIPGFLIRLRFSKKLYNFNKSISQAERKTYYFNRILTSIPFAKEIRLFGIGNYFSSKFLFLQKDLHSKKNTLLRKRLFADILAQTSAVTLIFLSFAYVTYLAVQGILSIGTVILFFLVFQRGFVVFRDLFQSLAGLYEDNVFLVDFFNFLDLPPFYLLENRNGKMPPSNADIKIESISFNYPSSTRKAIDSVTMTIPAGKTVAVVGANGSGKTTLVKLLCGFYQPVSGKIQISNIDTAKISSSEIQKQITAVFQDFALYNLSASENIFLGDVSKSPDIHLIKKAAMNAGIDDVLSNLPNGYDNLIGNLFEKSEELSIGQWQKMAIAKAFYRNSPILIMDEPSSALDAETELQLLQNLKSLAKNKTVLIISHRLSTIKWADKIYVMDNGKIIEEGTHDELISRRGNYCKMFEANRGN